MCVLYQDFDAGSLCLLRFECQVAPKNCSYIGGFSALGGRISSDEFDTNWPMCDWQTIEYPTQKSSYLTRVD